MKLNVPVLFAVLLATPSNTDADDPPLNVVERKLADVFYINFRENISVRLYNSGLAPSDIGRIIDSAVDAYARCAALMISSIEDPFADVFLSTLASDRTANEINSTLLHAPDSEYVSFFRELHALAEPCRSNAELELGIPIL